jgi:hypothetical protein
MDKNVWKKLLVLRKESLNSDGISGVMVSVLVLSAVDQTKDYKIGICCFSAKHAALRSKSKDWHPFYLPIV